MAEKDKETDNLSGSGSDRRTSTRVAIDIKLQLSIHQWEQEGSFSGQYVEGVLHDLSNNGLQINSIAPLAQDMFVVIHFPEEAKLPPITGKIIRIEERNEQTNMFSYGCLLSGIAPFTRKMLEEYIEEQAKKIVNSKF